MRATQAQGPGQAKPQERWRIVKETWNRQVERAEEEGVHVIHTKSYETPRKELRSIAHDDPDLGRRARDEVRAVIHRPDIAEQGHPEIEKYRDRLAGRLEVRSDALGFADSRDKRPIPDRENYEAWRDGTEETVAAAERVLANRREHGIHLDGVERRGGSLGSALSRVRGLLRQDDRHIAATLEGRRKGEDRWAGEDRIARLLYDPEKLTEMRMQRATGKRQRDAGERQRRGRYRSRGLSM